MIVATHVQDQANHLFWANRTFGFAALSDRRLIRRAVNVAAHLAAQPEDSIPQACGARADTKAAYRFFENTHVKEAILQESIAQSAVAACRGLAEIYAVQDTTSFNYTQLGRTSGLGPIGTSARARGIYLHSTLLVNSAGLPVGHAKMQFWSRPIGVKIRDSRRERAIEEKESYRWLQGARAAHDVLAGLENRPRLIHVGDREADIHAFFVEIFKLGDQAVIRCAQNRAVEGELDRAHAAVHAAPVLVATTAEVRRTSKFPARAAQVEIRALQVTLCGSKNLREHQPLRLALVEVWEPHPPSEEQRLLWRLWTTLPVDTPAGALKAIQIYKCRWCIEEVHLAAKSGCTVEELQLSTAERLRKALTMYMAVAVRIVNLKNLARQTPEAPCTVAFSTLEWQALWAHQHREICPAGTATPTLGEAVRWLAQLGGHLGRKGDGPPGIRTLWRGWRDLQLLATGYRLGRA